MCYNFDREILRAIARDSERKDSYKIWPGTKVQMSKNIRQRFKGKKIYALVILLSALCSLLFALCLPVTSYADDPLVKMRGETISFFKPMTGRITKVDGKEVLIDLGTKDSVKGGLRFTILREGATFIHPVTKRPLGRLESTVGKIGIKEVYADSSKGMIVTGEAKAGDKIRISEAKIRILFCQSNDVDWYMADSYHRSLKETGRFELIDTDIETDNPQEVIREAERLNAEVALLLTSKKVDTDIILVQRLFWVSDGIKFAEMGMKIDSAYAKELRFGDEFFKLRAEEASVEIDLPFGGRLLAVGDIDGDGNQEILLSTGKDIKIYMLGAGLQPALGGLSIKGSKVEDHLWIDTLDLNGNGRDEIIVTSMKRKMEAEDVYKNGSDEATISSMKGGGIISCIYELKDTEFVPLYKSNFFLRGIGNELIAQAYSKDEGFSDEVFSIVWDGKYKRSSTIHLPQGVNIYDFVYIYNTATERLILAYDDKGFLNLYDKDIKLWRGKTDTGGFLTTFKKGTPSMLIDKGEWAIKDRLFLRNREVLLVKRIPLLEMAKGFGYKKSQIKNLWWNGLSMEEGILIDNINGSILDYATIGDTIIVLASPMFGIKPENILKGENPLGSKIYIYSLKGR